MSYVRIRDLQAQGASALLFLYDSSFFSAKAKQLGSPCCCPYNYIPITVLFFLQSIDAYNFLDSVRHTFWEKIGKTVLKWPKPNSEPPTWSPLGNDQNIYSVAVLPLNIETYSTWYYFTWKCPVWRPELPISFSNRSVKRFKEKSAHFRLLFI